MWDAAGKMRSHWLEVCGPGRSPPQCRGPWSQVENTITWNMEAFSGAVLQACFQEHVRELRHLLPFRYDLRSVNEWASESSLRGRVPSSGKLIRDCCLMNVWASQWTTQMQYDVIHFVQKVCYVRLFGPSRSPEDRSEREFQNAEFRAWVTQLGGHWTYEPLY